VRLTAVELRRLLARRLTRIMLLFVLGVLAVIVGKTAYDSHQYTPGQVAAAQVQAAQEVEQWRAECRRNAPPEEQLTCDQIQPPELRYLLPTFRFAESAVPLVEGLAVALGLFGFVVGAGFLGAEWSAGTLAQQLVWEPRRLLVLAGKAAALVLGVGAVAAVMLAAEIGGLYGVARYRGTLEGTTAGVVRSVVLLGGRGVLLAVGTALAGFAIAGALRSTSGALGVGFAYFVAGEIAVRNFFPRSQPWLLTSNVAAWMDKRFEWYPPPCTTCANPGDQQVMVVTLSHAAAYLGMLVVAALLVSGLLFRSRDVT